jgi:hypothetical protein
MRPSRNQAARPPAWLSGGSVAEATTMGKFLEAFFTGLVKTGSIEIGTAGGHKFTLGEESGPKWGALQRQGRACFPLARPGTEFRRNVHGWLHRGHPRHDLRCPDAQRRQYVAAGRFALGLPAGKDAFHAAPDLSRPYAGLRNKALPTSPATTAPETGASQKNQS